MMMMGFTGGGGAEEATVQQLKKLHIRLVPSPGSNSGRSSVRPGNLRTRLRTKLLLPKLEVTRVK